MFERLQHFLHSLSGDVREEPGLTRDDPRVAAAALLHHVMEADGVIDENEKAKLRELLEKAYQLSGRELEEVLKAGRDVDEQSVDLYRMTSVLKRTLDAEQKVRFIELLWELVYADGVRHELEEHTVWRIAELLGVSTRDRVVMRQAVAGRRDGNGTADDGDL